jgi:hypothetical protein
MVTKKMPTKKLVMSSLIVDGSVPVSLEELQEALDPFGISVEEDPSCAGQDSSGFIFSNRPLTNNEIEEYLEEMPYEQAEHRVDR